MSHDFLSRWSRLKKEAEKTEQAEPSPDPAAEPDVALEGDAPDPAISAAEDARESPVSPAEAEPLLTEEEIAKLPPIDELTGTSDLAPFLRAGVPNVLRKAALRRIWAIDPAIRDFVDDARDYAYDWNTPGGMPGLGPLFPSDDVKAMVRRIFDGPCPASRVAAEPGEDETAATQAGRDEQRPERPDELESVESAACESVAAVPSTFDDPDRVTSAAPVEPTAENSRKLTARVRRHGGAMPV